MPPRPVPPELFVRAYVSSRSRAEVARRLGRSAAWVRRWERLFRRLGVPLPGGPCHLGGRLALTEHPDPPFEGVLIDGKGRAWLPFALSAGREDCPRCRRCGRSLTYGGALRLGRPHIAACPGCAEIVRGAGPRCR